MDQQNRALSPPPRLAPKRRLLCQRRHYFKSDLAIALPPDPPGEDPFVERAKSSMSTAEIRM